LKKFHFRLSTVLRIRETNLEIEKSKLAPFVAEEQTILRNISDISERCRQQNASIRELSTLRSGELRALSAYVLSSQAQIIALNENLARVRHAMALQRDSVLRAERNLKIILKMKEKRLREWEYKRNQQIETGAQEAWLAAHHKKFTEEPPARLATPETSSQGE
jgi:flagellar export protein FliJ